MGTGSCKNRFLGFFFHLASTGSTGPSQVRSSEHHIVQRWDCLLDQTGNAHGGSLGGDVLQSGPGGSTAAFCSVCPAVTAKHNLRRTMDEANNRLCIPMEASLQLSNTAGIDIVWDNLGWMPTNILIFAQPAFCACGLEASVGSPIANAENPACAAKASFQTIRKDFQFETGQKVGMAVSFTQQTKPTCVTRVGPDADEIPEHFGESAIKKLYYGEPDQVNIYTGEIKYLGSKHIECSINSFSGWAGDIVFLLDMDEPASVDQSDWGKAVAIYSGTHPRMSDQNCGFLINEHPAF